MLVYILLSFILVYLIFKLYGGLKLSIDELIFSLENLTPAKYLQNFLMIIPALLFLQWQLFGPFGAAPFKGASLVLYLIIFYEMTGAFIFVWTKDGYLQFLRELAKISPLATKIPVAIEFIFFLYLFLRDFLILF